MIDALIQGKLHAKAQQRTGKAGAPRVGLDLTAHAVLTAYHVTRKRRAVQPQVQPQDSAPPPPEHWPPPDAPFDL